MGKLKVEKIKQQVILNPKFPAEYDHLRYYGHKAIHNVFVMGAMGNIKTLRGNYNYINVEDCKDYVITKGILNYEGKEEEEEEVYIISWEFDPKNPICCLREP